MPAARQFLTDNLKEGTVTLQRSIGVLTYLDGLVIATEWPQFKTYNLDHKLIIQLKEAPIFDGRNCYDLAEVKAARTGLLLFGRAASY